jgi:hypothetical protein
MSDRQKEIDKLKKQKRKPSALEKKASQTKKRSWKTQEEIDVQRSKENYDRAELIRKKFIENLVKKTGKPMSYDDLIKKLVKLQKEMGELDDMKLFISLLQILKDDTKYAQYKTRILKNLMRKEYDTNVIIELLAIIKKDDDLLRRYNKLRYVNDETGEDFKIVETYGDIDTLIEKEKEFLISVLKTFVLKREEFRLESILKAEQEIRERKRILSPQEIEEIETQERLRKEFIDLLSMSEDDEMVEQIENDIEDILLFSKDVNTDLFLNVLKFLTIVLEKGEFNKFFGFVNEEYAKSFNTIIALLSVLENKEYDDMIRVNQEYLRDDDDESISVMHKLYNKVRFNIGKSRYLASLIDLYGGLDSLVKNKKIEFAILAYEEDMPNLFAKKGKGKDSTKFLENAREKLEYLRKLGEAQRIKTIKELEAFAEKEGIEIETLIKDARIQLVEEDGKKEILQFRQLVPVDFNIKQRVKKEEEDFDFLESDEYKKFIKSPKLDYRNNDMISEYDTEKKNKLRKEGQETLEEFFDKDSAKVLEEKMYRESKTVGDYINRLGEIVLFVDGDYLKKIAKLFNNRLQNMYYDANVILDLTVKEILQEIYNNPKHDEEQNAKLNELIDKNKKLFNYNTLKHLNRGPLQKLSDYKTFYNNKEINDIYPANTGMCSPKWEDDETPPRDIIYYHDKEDDNVYCFNIFQLYDQIMDNNIINPHTNKEFTQEFVNMIKHFSSSEQIKKTKEKEKQESPEKVKETNQKLDELYKNLNDLEMSLSSKVSKEQACAYYDKYVFTNSQLEKELDKTPEMIQKLKEFCSETKIEDEKNILDVFNIEESISIPHPSPSPSKSQKSSVVLQDQSLPSFLDAEAASIAAAPVQIDLPKKEPNQVNQQKKEKIQDLAKRLKKI